jgi:predicted acylesterase/phospholipase RssA
MTEQRERTALILSGGGAYGAYEVGIMLGLFQGAAPVAGNAPLAVDVFSGTSVGAFNAAMMTTAPEVSSQTAIERLRTVWTDQISDQPSRCGNGVYRIRGNPLRFANPSCFTRSPVEPFLTFADDAMRLSSYFVGRGASLLSGPGNIAQRLLQSIDVSTWISIEPFHELIRSVLDLDAINRSDKILRIAATDWTTGIAKIFSNSDMRGEFGRRTVQASAAIPAIFPPVTINGHVYIDGGVVENTPLQPAIDAGATMLHVIYVDPDSSEIPAQHIGDSLGAFQRVYQLLLAAKTNEDIATALWVNEGIEALEFAASGQDLSNNEVKSFVRAAGHILKKMKQGQKYSKLTIHRYHPHDELGGPFAMLDFGRHVIERLIRRGYYDAVNHNCRESLCILPKRR